MVIRTELNDPNKPTADDSKKGKLVRDEQGRWVLIKEQKTQESNAEIDKVTSLDQRVIANIIAQSSITLARSGVNTSRLDCELLMMFVLGLDRTQLVKNWTKKIKDEDHEKFHHLLERRLKREPIAYIIGYKEFFGLKFMVDNRVLIPRPETELLVERALNFIKTWEKGNEQLAVVDIGTGCGCISLSIAREVNFAKIYAVDISPEALEVARINASLLSIDQNVAFLHGDILTPLPQPVHIMIANLPYISDSKFSTLEPEIQEFEPKQALIGGEDGLDYYRRLLAQAPQFLLKGGKILMEIDPEQVDLLRTIILQHLPQTDIEVAKDLNNQDRVVIVHA